MAYEIDQISSTYYDNQEERFLDQFKQEWEKLTATFPYSHPQFALGNRIRPRLVFWGYSAVNELKEDGSFYFAVKIALVIELIHKTSILLDDFLDGDVARRGVESFHITYGVEKTVIFSLHLIGRAIKMLNQLYDSGTITTGPYLFLVDRFGTTMTKMTEGVLQELELNEETVCDKNLIKEIIDKETAELLTASILFGYCAAEGQNPFMLNRLERIGRNCGYLFQSMNDMEAWCQAKKNTSYKGNLNLDADRNRKSIVLSTLYCDMNRKEKKMLATLEEKEKPEYLLRLFQSHQVAQNILREMDMVYKTITQDISSLRNLSYVGWSDKFARFISKVYALCRQRLTN